MAGLEAKATIVTFADKSHRGAHRRFRSQARGIRAFDRIVTITEDGLDRAFRSRFDSILQPHVRGFGYWVWKPQIILQALRDMCPGDFLVYLDSGSHLNRRGRAKLIEYFKIAQFSETGILCFQTKFLEESYSKRDLVSYFGVEGQPIILETGQVQAGALIVHLRDHTEAFFRRWLETFEDDIALVDDSVSELPNVDCFVEHRHDQSVLSLLSKTTGVTLLSAADQSPCDPSVSWSDLAHEPIHHRRDLSSRFQKFRRKILNPFPGLRLWLYVRFRKWISAVKDGSD